VNFIEQLRCELIDFDESNEFDVNYIIESIEGNIDDLNTSEAFFLWDTLASTDLSSTFMGRMLGKRSADIWLAPVFN